ncbi:ATP-dependent DNA helicase PIF1 [Brachionus plicatilis]|uniref:ATP-dependent DNA helicase PIF1 n=1 Tax=Brachionus plicatilis TaxID=10195 RepID=A0A3M7Q6N8_BRAPC|nr:ATP-dependent DNA helicase PIF1 [Brachionus plicatilis]
MASKKNTDYIINDEISMLNDLMLDDINEIEFFFNGKKEKLFGGKYKNILAYLSKESVARDTQLQKNKKAIESRPKFFNRLDVDSVGHRLSNFYSDLIDKIPGSLERMLKIYPDNRIMIVKIIEIESELVNGALGAYLDSSEKLFEIRLEGSGMVIYRIEFPVVDVTAQNVHKVQGTTLKRVHVSIDSSLFAHGQAYVALSRQSIKADQQIVQLLEYIKKTIMEIPILKANKLSIEIGYL